MNSNPSLEHLNKFTGIILDSAIRVHREMGPGLLESVYQNCLFEELEQRKIEVKQMVTIPLFYRGKLLNKEYVIDLLVEDEIIVELKAAECLLPVHEAQVISYLRLAKKKIGLLINFNVPLLKQGFRRFIN